MTKSAKPEITNIHVSNISRPAGRSYSIGWSIGADRYHVWAYKGEIAETIYKNCAVELKRGDPGHYETRQLNRNSKAQSAIFDDVLATVERLDLIKKAERADLEALELGRKISEIRHAIANLEAEALAAFRAGDFAHHPAAIDALYSQHRSATEQLKSLGAGDDELEAA